MPNIDVNSPPCQHQCMSKPKCLRPESDSENAAWGAWCKLCGKAWWEESESLARQMSEDHVCSEQDMKDRL